MPPRHRPIAYHTPGATPDADELSLIEALQRYWLKRVDLTVSELVQSCAYDDACLQRMKQRTNAWMRTGVLVVQEGGNSPIITCFNHTERPVAGQSLRAAVADFLADPTVGANVRHSAGVAIRVATRAPKHTPESLLLAHCEAIPATDAAHLLTGAVTAFVAQGWAPQTTANRLSGLRAFLRHAAHHRRVPLVFPVEHDRYAAAARRYYAPTPETPDKQRNYLRDQHNRYLTFIVRARRVAASDAGFGEWPEDPDDMSPNQAERVLRDMQREGLNADATRSATALTSAARRGFGPFRRGRADHEIAPQRRLRDDSVALKRPDGGQTQDWEAMVGMLRELGFPSELTGFLTWMADYLTLDLMQLMAQPARYPERSESRQLDAGSLVNRNHALKVWLGTATARCGIAAADLTIERAFVTSYREIAAAVFEYWSERTDAGMASSKYGAGLSACLVHVGVTADIASAYLHHRRTCCHRADDGVADGKRHAVDWAADQSAQSFITSGRAVPTPFSTVGRAPYGALELALQHTKVVAYSQVAWIKRQREAVAPTKAGSTRKDVQRLVDSASIATFEHVQSDALSEVQQRAAAGDDSRGFHELVADTFLHGCQMSFATRAQELTHLRLDIHYPERERRGTRQLTLRGVDRKQRGGAHYLFMLDRYVPAFLETLFLERSRPFLMQRLGTKEKHGRPLADHPFLFVNRLGRPFGCLEEQPDGAGRAVRPWRTRIQGLVRTWKAFAAPRLFALGYTVPLDWGELTIHAMRARASHATADTYGIEDAAKLLGDTVASIDHHYRGDAKRRHRVDPYGTDAAHTAEMAGVERPYSNKELTGAPIVAKTGSRPRRDVGASPLGSATSATRRDAADHVSTSLAMTISRSPNVAAVPLPMPTSGTDALSINDRRALAAEAHRHACLSDSEFFALLKRLKDEEDAGTRGAVVHVA